MAIHDGYESKNTITGLDVKWEGKTGVEVEDFICRRFDQPLNPKMDYINNTLTIYNPEGKPIAEGKVIPVSPTYTTEITFSQLNVNGVSNTSDVEVNYNKDTTFHAGINIKTYYDAAGTKYDLFSKVDVTFSIEGTTDQLVVTNITPNQLDDESLQFVDITPLLQKGLYNKTLKASVQANNKTGTHSYPGSVTIHKIELSTDATCVSSNTIPFKITGLNNSSGMYLEYFDVVLGHTTLPKTPSRSDFLQNNSEVSITLDEFGAHQIIARVTNEEGTFYSNWVQANIISHNPANPSSMNVIIGKIPTEIINCDSADLYKLIYVPGLGGEAEILTYLTDEPGNFINNTNWDSYLFNQTVLTTTANDLPNIVSYKSYVELFSVGSSTKAIAFKLKLKEGNQTKEYPIYQLAVTSNKQLQVGSYFTINIKENPYNVANAFNYTSGPVEDFSQITGHSTSMFDNVSSNIDTTDGWTVDGDLIAYKISAQNKNLYNTPKDLSTILNSGQGFTIEVMLKNYNINGDDPVMTIGNLLFGPGFTQVDSDDKSDEGVFVNSRADFEKDTVTHLMFVFDPNYKPKTYSNVYDDIFNEDGVNYSQIEHTYPILKVFVNGCINREIQIDVKSLKKNNEFKLQICPKTSDLNLYIFRTYSRALTYSEIQKNFISSRLTSLEKKTIYDRNNILAEDGKISFYKSMLNHNVLVFVLPVGEKPLFFGNKNSAGDGQSNATILVRYKNSEYKNACGRFTGGSYKAQGSSAKKYMFHNTQYSKYKFLSEEQIANGITEGSSTYVIPTDPEKIGVKKLVGKVNYASSMQSHKQGATKLYDRAYKEIFPENTLYNGGKKACLEEAFMYFYYNVDDNSKLDTVTIEDLYTISEINGLTVIDDSKVKFFGFQTWGSAKADDPTYGYDDDKTPEYVLFEGADNASPGANFKQPWAAFQTWDSTKTKSENQNISGVIVQQPKSVTETDFTKGLLIEGETIQFENDTDPLDVDYGVELLILDGQSKENAKERDLWKFTDAVKNNSLPYFVNFYNNCYQYDFTNLVLNPDASESKFDIKEKYDLTDKRIYVNVTTPLYENGVKTSKTAKAWDVYRWDAMKSMWVPAGLHYVDSNWESFNLQDVYNNLKNSALYNKYKGNSEIISANFEGNFATTMYPVETLIIPAFRDMFRATIEEYCDKEDIAYHQAFIRLVSGTDNRAKNTYFQIIGKLYEGGIQTDKGDYKIRLMQDDLDTIFATDNNGQQVKPYYLLEPPFNKTTEKMWGDTHSSFFYPFDVCYSELINVYLGKIIQHLFGAFASVKSEDPGCNLYNYFFSVQKQFPEIAYNHHAEIYYEVPQVLYYNNKLLQIHGVNVFPTMLSGFSNNNVKNPLSLSHGRCLESEYQFMKDRLLMLGTSTTTASGLYSSDRINVSTVDTGGAPYTTTLKGSATYTDYFYPIKSTTTTSEFIKIGNVSDLSNSSIKPDVVFEYILPYPYIPATIRQLVTPEMEYDINCEILTTMGSFLNASSKYKSLKIVEGLDYTHTLLDLPKAQSLEVDGFTAKYTIDDSEIIVKNHLPIIEKLIITNTKFANSVLDFRGCTRLEELNLSGCTGIVDIILPESSRLKTVALPSGIQKITIGKTPNLSSLQFDEGTYLTDVSLDCSAFHEDFDYMDILLNKIDYSNLKQFIIKNTPEKGLMITEDIALKFATISLDKNITSLVSGKYMIKDRIEQVDDNYNTIFSWGNFTDISYNTKKILVHAFSDIDSTNNLVYFEYLQSTLMRDSAQLSSLISIDVPSTGITINPFDSLYFTEGNDVGIKNGILNISYTITSSNFPGTLNTNTGEITVTQNTNKAYNYSILVTRSDGKKLDPITGQLYLGYIEPAIGDYAYSDGTFSAIYDSNKTLVGLVFQKQIDVSGKQWTLGVLSNKAITDYIGPDYYYWKSGSGFPTNNTNQDQAHIFNFMTNASGLEIDMESPNTNAYLGINSGLLTSSINTTITYNKPYTDSPIELVKSGKEITEALRDVGLDRLKIFASKSSDFKSYLKNNNYMDEQNNFTKSWDSEKLKDVFNNFTTAIVAVGFDKSDYYKVLHPMAFRVSNFVPENLSGKGLDYYNKGNWYIPSVEELGLLIWYRIRSTAKSTTTAPETYWDSNDYTNGNSIFSNTHMHFGSFLGSPMIAANVSADNKNFVYGKVYNYNSSNYDYTWSCTYDPDDWSGYHHNANCIRDQKYSIAPCCVITVNKES